jgi:predicted transcriptional regulator
MNQKKSFVLTKKDRKAARLFTELGMSKNLAKTLMYLSHVDECYSDDIEQGAHLRQPEVSLVMQELRRRKWVKKRTLKKKGKGRPRNVYKTTTHLFEILNDFEQEKLEEVEVIKGDISELKNLIESR